MLLDSASLYFRAFFGVPDQRTTPDETPTNALRGFLDMVATLVTAHRPTHLVACWDDDWRPQWRVDLVPTYKTHRLVDGSDVVEESPDDLTPAGAADPRRAARPSASPGSARPASRPTTSSAPSPSGTAA